MTKLAYGRTGGKGLSYSRLLTAHLCPRKFQLENIFGLGMRTESVTFSYGHAVAAGVQSLVVHPDNLNLALVSTLAAWGVGIHEEELSDKKSLWYAIKMVQKFHSLISHPATNFLRNYEVAYFPDNTGRLIPAVELTFCIECHSDYVYEGHIDLVLKEREANKYLVLELKTTKFVNINEASYKNSAQALGYSLALDSIARDMDAEGSYAVMYLVAKSTAQEYEPFVFNKTRAQRAQFINELLLDIEILEMYREVNIYPTRGESCFNFFRPCEYFNKCHLSDNVLMALKQETDTPFAELPRYNFVYQLDEIMKHQLQVIEVQ